MSRYDSIDKMSSEMEELRNKYVPYSGKADTVGGEILRALDRITYRYFNDGDMVDVGYGIETVNSSFRYLCDIVPQAYELYGWDPEYEQFLERLWGLITNYLHSHMELFQTKNSDDSRIMSEEEIEALRQYENEGYEEEEEYDDEDY